MVLELFNAIYLYKFMFHAKSSQAALFWRNMTFGIEMWCFSRLGQHGVKVRAVGGKEPI